MIVAMREASRCQRASRRKPCSTVCQWYSMSRDEVVECVRSLLNSDDCCDICGSLKESAAQWCECAGVDAVEKDVGQAIDIECSNWQKVLRETEGREQFLWLATICHRFLKAIDLLPSFIPQTNSVLMLVSCVQRIVGDNDLMVNITGLLCTTIQEFIIGESGLQDNLKVVLVVLKSLKAVELLNVELPESLHFAPDLGSRQRCLAHLEAVFEYLERTRLVVTLLSHPTLAKRVFQESIANSMVFYTTGIEPVIGWILSKNRELVIRLLLTFQEFQMKTPNLWAPCCQFFYDNMFMDARSETNIERIVATTEEFTDNFVACFENKRTAMTELEYRIRLFLNDPRINFPYFWAQYLKTANAIDSRLVLKYTLRIDNISYFMAHMDGAPEAVLATCKQILPSPTPYTGKQSDGRGAVSKKSAQTCREKIQEVLSIKGTATRTALMFDAYLLIKRKIRTDQSMILDAIDALISEGTIQLRGELYTLPES